MKTFKAFFIFFSMFLSSQAFSRVTDLKLDCYASGKMASETFGKTLFDGIVNFDSGYSQITSIFETADNISGVVSRGPDNRVCIGLLQGYTMLTQSCGPIGKMSEYNDLRFNYNYSAGSLYLSCGLP